MAGEFDDHLRWPFKGEVTIQLVNQSKNGENWEKIVKQSNLLMNSRAFHRVRVGDRADQGWGFAKFILHDDLYKPAEGNEYLVNDIIQFRVTKCVAT